MQFLNLIVKNVDSSATEDDLRKFFDQFGQVHGIKLLSEAQCAFVSFKDRESARTAKVGCTQQSFNGRFLYANFCGPKESR
jgi:RNA recognition motif-containing protein